MRIFKLLILIIFVGPFSLMAQQTEDISPKGKPFMKIFSNFHAVDLTGDIAPGFQLKRAYLGYSYNFNPNFSAKINIDVGNPGVGSLQHSTFIKNAEMTYKTGKFSVNFGMISTKLFKVQEELWGHRYLMKTFSDEYKLGHSADLGVNVSFKPISFITVDAIVLNGEGYKNEQADSTFKTGVGVTFEPIKKLQLRAYYETMPDKVNQNTLAAFVGYHSNKLDFGIEYNKQWNHHRHLDQDYGGLSSYFSYHINKRFELFGRYDNLSSVEKEGEMNPWNLEKDGQMYMLGFEITAVKGIKVAPNFRGWKSAIDGSSMIFSAFVNVEIAI